MGEIETVRRVIQPTDCDMLGHMNVSKYFDVVSDGGFTLQAECGLDRADMTQGRRLSFVVVHADSSFRAELLAGDRVYLRSCVMEIGGKSALFRHRLYRAGDDVLSFEAQFRTVLMNLSTRRAVTLPQELKQRLSQHLVAVSGQ